MSDKLSAIMREKRASLKLTKLEMAKKLKCSVHVINHLEGSKFDPIGVKTMETVKKTFRGMASKLGAAMEKRNAVAKPYYKEMRARNLAKKKRAEKALANKIVVKKSSAKKAKVKA